MAPNTKRGWERRCCQLPHGSQQEAQKTQEGPGTGSQGRMWWRQYSAPANRSDTQEEGARSHHKEPPCPVGLALGSTCEPTCGSEEKTLYVPLHVKYFTYIFRLTLSTKRSPRSLASPHFTDGEIEAEIM